MPRSSTLASLIILISLLGTALTAHAGIITVDSAADNQPGDACTLRQAIALVDGSGNTGNCQADGKASPPEIHFDLSLPATITLDAGLGQLNPTASVLIQGPGMDQLTLSGNNQVRVFSSSSNDVTLYLRDLRIANGRSPDGFAGGGIEICCGFGLDLARVHVHNNHSNFAGGGIEASGNIVMRDSIVQGNTAVDDNPAGTFLSFGGGVRVPGFASQALFERVQFIGNTAGSFVAGANPGLGGALATANSRVVTVIDSSFSGNFAAAAQQRTGFNPIPTGLGGQGGAIYNFAEVNLTGSTLESNVAVFEGGGIFNVGTMRASNATINNNTVPDTSSPSEGGGIANAASNGFGNQVILELTHVTLWGNSAGLGGGLHNRRANTEQVLIHNSAFGHLGTGQAGGDIVNGGDGELTGTHNLVESGSAAGGLVDGVDGNIIGTSAEFIELGDFGGSTPTVSFGTGSPLLDAADPVVCPATDQRGVPRPQGNGCDIGAVELMAEVFGDRFEAMSP
jgi:hypothetical protein